MRFYRLCITVLNNALFPGNWIFPIGTSKYVLFYNGQLYWKLQYCVPRVIGFRSKNVKSSRYWHVAFSKMLINGSFCCVVSHGVLRLPSDMLQQDKLASTACVGCWRSAFRRQRVVCASSSSSRHNWRAPLTSLNGIFIAPILFVPDFI